jgi:drug/metabolite transporter (DMT)-like permease
MLNFLAWHLLVGVLPLTPLPWLLELPSVQWSAAFAGLLVWTAVVSTALGFVMWIEILRHLSAGAAALNMFAIPVIALLSSMAIFGERLTASEWAGIACIAGALCILSGHTLARARDGRGPAPTPPADPRRERER